MDTKILASVNQEVYRRFPLLNGKRPKVQSYRPFAAALSAEPPAGQPAYLMLYQGQASAPNQKVIPLIVRVLVDRSGRILKISSSR
jgi:hypothetical protein